MKILAIAVIVWIILAVVAWSMTAINATVGEPPSPPETPEKKKWIESRIAYHGLQKDGVVILYMGEDGEYRFHRDGEWCKL